MFGAVATTTPGCQSTAFVSIVVDLEHCDLLTDEKTSAGGHFILEGLPEGPELLVVAVGVDGDVFDRVFQIGETLLVPYRLNVVPARRSIGSTMNPLAVIESRMGEIRALGARRIGIFGSFARGQEREDSDVDVYVEFDDDKRTYDNFFALHELLESLLGRRVDLVTDKALTETRAQLILPTVRYASVHA
ncbi:nucleotidyltransferase family protein [Candidatus Binatia bacterium]|nr:nucleotidyltransferase family protein [Candidatus Binatia bacterium]